MNRIDDLTDSWIEFRRWVKKHPRDKPSEDELAKWHQDPLRAKRFLESKGFVFTQTDEEFVQEHERLNLPYIKRMKLRWKEQLAWFRGLSRKQRGWVVMNLSFFLMGALCFLLGVLFLAQFAPILKLPRNYADPTIFRNTLDLVWFLGVVAVCGTFIFCGVFLWSFSNQYYSYYLESRLAFLEKKVAALEKEKQLKGEEKPESTDTR